MQDHPRYSRIEIRKQALNFSVAHFTIFSQRERENLHGHNYFVECDITAPVGEDGLMFDYSIIKRALREACDELDEQMLLPANSPFLKIETDGDYTVAIFNGERLPFLSRDLTILPIANTTIEELSRHLLGVVLANPLLADRGIIEMTVKVSSSPGQTGCAHWAST